MPLSVSTFRCPSWLIAAAVAGLAVLVVAPRAANAEALLLIEADSGKVLVADNATYPWYPASLTKMMTAYVTLQEVKAGRLGLDTLITVSPTAAAQQPSKMGFAPGTRLTVDNALKMLMVRSANDMAVTLAEGVGGSIDGFSALMNETAQRLGMTQSHFVNPNGLPAEGQVVSARDMGILARAIIRDLPDYEYYVHIPAIKFGRRVTQNFNRLIGRYPGADGMKTGFICASGFNLVASATRNGRRLIAVVLGASSSRERAIKAAELLDRGFGAGTLAWLRPALGTVEGLAPINAAPPNLRDEVCGPRRKRPAAENEDETAGGGEETGFQLFAAGFQPAAGPKPAELLAMPAEPAEPVIVYTGPARSGAAVIAAAEEEAQRQDAQAAKARAARDAKRKQAAAARAAKAKHAGKHAGKGEAAAKPKTVVIDTRAKAAPTAAPTAAPRHNGAAAQTANAAAKTATQKTATQKTATQKPAAQKPAAPKAAAKPAATGDTGQRP